LEDPQHRGCFAGDRGSDDDRIFGNEIADVPDTIRYGLLAPYADGVRFVKRLLRMGGWARVDEAWLDGIRSTRELFPETTGTLPCEDLPIATPPLPGCAAEFIDILGEQGLASVLFKDDNIEETRRLASSLIADRAAYWQCGNSCVGVWRLRIGTSDDAMSLAAALRSSLGISGAARDFPYGCVRTSVGVRSLVQYSRDIVITSVHNCDHSNLEIATSPCELANKWARRLISSAADTSKLSR
jgi:hypothetical protein